MLPHVLSLISSLLFWLTGSILSHNWSVSLPVHQLIQPSIHSSLFEWSDMVTTVIIIINSRLAVWTNGIRTFVSFHYHSSSYYNRSERMSKTNTTMHTKPPNIYLVISARKLNSVHENCTSQQKSIDLFETTNSLAWHYFRSTSSSKLLLYMWYYPWQEQFRSIQLDSPFFEYWHKEQWTKRLKILWN